MIDFISKNSLDTPVLFLIFNRPDHSIQVLNQIRKVRPKKLFIASDGPRENQLSDLELCQKTREVILNLIDWECEVQTLFRKKNLGCAVAVSEAISWFFKHVEKGIILEDDCFPSVSFFNFCEILLKKYSDNSEIMHIGGCNLNYKPKIKYSYFFTRYNLVWGWATNRKSWANFSLDLSNKEAKKLICENILETNEQNQWINYLDADSWAIYWSLTIWRLKGLAILPSRNLVKNIGFGSDGTHTRNYADPRKDLPIYTTDVNLAHTVQIIEDLKFAKYRRRLLGIENSAIQVLKRKIHNAFFR